MVQLLDAKRAALNAARERYRVAKSARDEQSMSDEARLIDQLIVLIPELEKDAQVVREAAGRKEAEHRLKKIPSAAGSHRAEYKKCDARVREAQEELNEANAERTSWARKYEALQAEANALADRFDLSPVKLEVIPEPERITSPTPWQYRLVRPTFEQCEHNLRQRRDYSEISGSPGYAVIQTTGLRPFRDLTAQEKAVLENREEEWKPDPVLQQAATEANALANLKVPGGHVHSG
jgi:hypothetical protein